MDFAALIAQMQTAQFYPHPVKLPIELIQTHISCVFLTGEYAYKLKKNVNFGFLDFSSLEKRRHFLAEELRLNKPLAPELYLEILPIRQQGEKYSLEGEGEIVEYVLKMRQFPQENLFINLFTAGKLSEADIENWAKVVAKFHQETTTNEYILGFGTVEKIKQSVDENYQQTSKYIGITQTQQQYAATKAFTEQFFRKNAALFAKRQADKKIKECHGDLHLKNICLWQNKIQLFDRIEFNEPFRFVDTMYDVAFAVMDLDARGRQDFSNIFLNTYLEQTGDWEGAQLLPLYLSRQAYVRAKVNSFLLDDPNIPAAVKEEAKKAAADYYHLAWQYTQRNPGKITMMSGLSGSGKSTTAKKIALETNSIIIRSDAVRKHLAGIPLSSKGTDDIYTPAMSEKTYQRMLDLGIALARAGFSVILDAKYDKQKFREQVITAAKSHNLPLEIVYTHAPLEVLRDRLQQRTNDISDAGVDLLSSQQANFEPFTPEEKQYLKQIDTSMA